MKDAKPGRRFRLFRVYKAVEQHSSFVIRWAYSALYNRLLTDKTIARSYLAG